MEAVCRQAGGICEAAQGSGHGWDSEQNKHCGQFLSSGAEKPEKVMFLSQSESGIHAK